MFWSWRKRLSWLFFPLNLGRHFLLADLEGRTFREFFQTEIQRQTRVRKGIIGSRLGETQDED
jgi:hypothetical protein